MNYPPQYIPLFQAIDQLMAVHTTVRVAIDGPCASGKSTLGRLIAQHYGCPLVPMDDFFLTPELRTPERLQKPGENVDHQRFRREVMEPLSQGRPAAYRPFLCRSMAFGEELRVEPSTLLVVEGAYSLRPDLRDWYQLRVWLETSWPTRRQRLLDRGGQACLEQFKARWIPLEERYFQAYSVKACCHLILSGEG